MFTENGKWARLSQTGAIMRYFGIRYGYYDPKNWQQACHIDPIVDTWSDICAAFAGIAFAPDADKPAAIDKAVNVAKKVNALAEKSLVKCGGPFIAGKKVTIADFFMASYMGNMVTNPLNPASQRIIACLDETPKFKAYCETLKKEFPHLSQREVTTMM